MEQSRGSRRGGGPSRRPRRRRGNSSRRQTEQPGETFVDRGGHSVVSPQNQSSGQGQLSGATTRMIKLLGPLNNPKRLSEFAKFTSTPILCPLSVSTRGIGFVISELKSRLRYPCCGEFPVAAIYRVSLAQLEAKIYFSNLKWPPNVPATEFRQVLPYGMMRLAREGCPMNFSPIACIIDLVGNVEFNRSRFCPVILPESSPLNLHANNLRDYCTRMSSPETDSLERVKGFQLNSIPHAKWVQTDENDPTSVRLANPDDIMPPEYGESGLYNDIMTVQRFLSSVRVILPEAVANVDYSDCRGDPGLLVSSLVVPEECLVLENGVLSNKMAQFWSRDSNIHGASWNTGVFSLAGEITNVETAGQRSKFVETPRTNDWRELCNWVVRP